MTRHELGQYKALQSEIIMWRKRLYKLRQKSLVGPPKLSDMPKGGKGYTVEDYCAQLDFIERKISELMFKADEQSKKIMEFINNIDDSLVRCITYMKNIEGRSWLWIGYELGKDPEVCRKKYEKYLRSL